MTDLEFVQQCVSGDKRAWDEFVDKYSKLIYNYIISILNRYLNLSTQEHIQDIFQEIFLSLVKDDFRKLKTFKGKNGCSLASWLRQVTINYTIDYLRKLKPLASIDAENDDGLSLKSTLVDDAASASDTSINNEQIMQLSECINILEDEDKYFLELHFNQGVRLEDLKELLRASRGAVDMRKSRIIAQLRDCFKNKGFGLDF